jgi:hypothetical protein
MTTFVIGTDNNIVAFGEPEQAQDLLALGGQAFTSEHELAQLAAEWPILRLVEIWNSFAGVVPFADLRAVTKFENRAKAVTRIWRAIQKLAPACHDDAPVAPEATGREKITTPAKKAARRAQGAKKPKPEKQRKHGARVGSKKAEVIHLLRRKGGASLKDIMKATGWQAHSVRGFISGTLGKRMDLKVDSTKAKDGQRTYSIKG